MYAYNPFFLRYGIRRDYKQNKENMMRPESWKSEGNRKREDYRKKRKG